MSNYDLYQKRLETSRIVPKSRLDSLRLDTFKKALLASYNAEDITAPNGEVVKALIVEIEQSAKPGEKKRFATLNEHGFKIGDSFFWERDKSHWLIMDKQEAESAFFQAYAQRCNFEVKWRDLETGILYTTRAVNSSPEAETINDKSSKKLYFDSFTDKIHLTIAKNTKGAHLLKRYGEIIVNTKKWTIHICDDYSEPDLMFLSLVEAAIDRDRDDMDAAVVDGKVDVDFTIKTNLTGITELQLGTSLPLQSHLYRNNNLIDEPYLVYTSNCSYNAETDVLTLDSLGPTSVKIYYNKINKIFTLDLIVHEVSTAEVYEATLNGNVTVKTLMQEEYFLVYTLNGTVLPSPNGSWFFDTKFADVVESDDLHIKLKMKNETGSFTLVYLDEFLVPLVEKTIKVLPIFGRS